MIATCALHLHTNRRVSLTISMQRHEAEQFEQIDETKQFEQIDKREKAHTGDLWMFSGLSIRSVKPHLVKPLMVQSWEQTERTNISKPHTSNPFINTTWLKRAYGCTQTHSDMRSNTPCTTATVSNSLTQSKRLAPER